MAKAPISLIRTWLFLSQATDPKLSRAKADASERLIRQFGSLEMAQIYLEQSKDEKIEVVLV